MGAALALGTTVAAATPSAALPAPSSAADTVQAPSRYPPLPEDYVRQFCRVEPIVNVVDSGTALTCNDPTPNPRQFRATVTCQSPKRAAVNIPAEEWSSVNGGRSEAYCPLRPFFAVSFSSQMRG